MVDFVRSLSLRRAWLAAAVLLAAQAAAVRAAEPGAAAVAATPAASSPAQRMEDFGVELVGVRLSGADFLIDVRYRVKDIGKAQALLERKIHPVLVNEATGDRFYIPQVPKVGTLRQSATSKQPAQLDKVYFMLFANPDRKLRAGEKVTLHAGESTVRGLLVQ
ncbi:hypothetical protein [Variovorax sp. YR752]|uniref:hypothetical protein n=1 Tax=Variovorax sp. YR752 TaxID=1884383 RepID=UPI0031383A59